MEKNVKKYANVLCFVLCMALCLMPVMRVDAGEARPEYKVMVNRAANCVTVYEKSADGEFVPVKAFVCSVGRAGHETPLGTFRTSDYYTWRLMVDGTYGQYAVRFNRGIMFHSVPYYTLNAANLEWEQYNLLGEPASLGCVRLACNDAKWIYDNCARGTEVVVYDDAGNPGPLGKPTEMKIAADNPMKNWDPTNTEERNPWNTVRPLIYFMGEAANDVLPVLAGSPPETVYSLMGMMNPQGNPYAIGDYTISLSGEYDFNTPGIYDVLVRVVTVPGFRTERYMKLWVVQPIVVEQTQEAVQTQEVVQPQEAVQP